MSFFSYLLTGWYYVLWVLNWNHKAHKEHKEKEKLFFVLFVSFVVQTVTVAPAGRVR